MKPSSQVSQKAMRQGVARRQPQESRVLQQQAGNGGIRAAREQQMAFVALAAVARVAPEIDVIVDHRLRGKGLRLAGGSQERRLPARPGGAVGLKLGAQLRQLGGVNQQPEGGGKGQRLLRRFEVALPGGGKTLVLRQGAFEGGAVLQTEPVDPAAGGTLQRGADFEGDLGDALGSGQIERVFYLRARRGRGFQFEPAAVGDGADGQDRARRQVDRDEQTVITTAGQVEMAAHAQHQPVRRAAGPVEGDPTPVLLHLEPVRGARFHLPFGQPAQARVPKGLEDRFGQIDRGKVHRVLLKMI